MRVARQGTELSRGLRACTVQAGDSSSGKEEEESKVEKSKEKNKSKKKKKQTQERNAQAIAQASRVGDRVFEQLQLHASAPFAIVRRPKW